MTRFDPADDFQRITDGLEELTLTPAGGSPPIVLQGLRRPPTRTEVSQLHDTVGLKLEDVIWHLSDAALGGHVPRVGDTLTDTEAVVWTIIGTSRQVFRQHWRVICQSAA